MPSSISSFSQPPRARWARVLGGAVLLLALAVAYMELRLAWRGFRPTVVDSEALWLEQRARASALGERALILLGSSRMQVDADLGVLRARTGLEPVQLAIDGRNFRPVLAGLAADETIRGTVIVDFSDHLLAHEDLDEVSYRWQAAYERARARPRLPDFETSERWLSHQLRQRLRSYADGAQPLLSVWHRLLPAQATQQYLITLQDRSKLADYSKVPMPAFYYARVQRNLGFEVPVEPDMTYQDVDRALRRRIEALEVQHQALPAYRAASAQIAAQAQAIRARGGQVRFVVFPSSGLVRAIEERRFPRPVFWDAFAATAGGGLHADDVPAWQALHCPDGSHLDVHQRAYFTHALVEALGLARS